MNSGLKIKWKRLVMILNAVLHLLKKKLHHNCKKYRLKNKLKKFGKKIKSNFQKFLKKFKNWEKN